MQPAQLEDALDDLIARVRRRAAGLGGAADESPASLGILRMADVALAATAPLARSDAAVDERRERLRDAVALLREHAL